MNKIHGSFNHLKHQGKIRIALLVFLLIISLLGAWFYQRSFIIVIEDAHIAADMINISSEVSGQIKTLHVSRGQQVSKGDPLVSIDDRATKLMLKTAQYELDIAQLKLQRSERLYLLKNEQNESIYQAQLARVASTKALVNNANILTDQANSELKRANKLLKEKLISDQQWEKNKIKTLQSQQMYLKLQADLSRENAELVKTESMSHETELLAQDIAILKAKIASLKVTIKRHQLDLTIKNIVSPINGVIDNIFVNEGEYVVPIRRLLMLHDPNNLWISANIKETKVNQIHLGDKAIVSIDAYPDLQLNASVTHIDNAATSQYALLPNPTPSGSFTKVTQRITIKLAIDDNQANSYHLKPGMMVEVDINTQP